MAITYLTGGYAPAATAYPASLVLCLSGDVKPPAVSHQLLIEVDTGSVFLETNSIEP